MDISMDELQRIVFDEQNDWAECSKCGFSQDVEPDADYPCPECGEGQLTSNLMRMGLI